MVSVVIRQRVARATAKQIPFGNDKPKANAEATANAGILRFAQNDVSEMSDLLLA
jgi:hypothetical protein